MRGVRTRSALGRARSRLCRHGRSDRAKVTFDGVDELFVEVDQLAEEVVDEVQVFLSVR